MSYRFINQQTAEAYDTRNLQYIGWEVSAKGQGGYEVLFSQQNVDFLFKTIHSLLQERGYNMVITPQVLSGVMSQVARTNDPVIGDIFTRYAIPPARDRDDLGQLNTRIVNTIVNTIVDEMENTKHNESLSAWSTVLGDFNREGLRSHDILKTKENDYMKSWTHWNY